MALVLHAGNTNKNAFKALIAAEYSGVEVKLVQNFEMGVSNKTPEFLKMNPMGKVPVLETPDGPIFESNAIARYVTRSKADNPLFGSTLIDSAHIEQWIDFASMEIDANISKWLYPRLGLSAYLPPAEEAAIAWLKRALGALSIHLASNTYLVGHSVSRIVHDPSAPSSFFPWMNYSVSHHIGAISFLIVNFFLFFGVAALTVVQASQISRNITTNEMANVMRYSYLRGAGGQFRNPYDHGCRKNCSDFLIKGYNEDIQVSEDSAHSEGIGMVQMPRDNGDLHSLANRNGHIAINVNSSSTNAHHGHVHSSQYNHGKSEAESGSLGLGIGSGRNSAYSV